MLDMDSKARLKTEVRWKTGPQCESVAAGPSQSRLSIGGHILSLASDIGALEECLALERSSRTGLPVGGAEGIQSPPAVPYCDFLTIRSRDGRLQAVCRLLRLDRKNTLVHPLKSDRFRLSPLITAIRYSREGILEVGAIAYAPGFDQERLAGLMWTGILRFLERNGVGFVIGQEALAPGCAHADEGSAIMEAYGLHPDLEVDIEANSQAHVHAGPFRTMPNHLLRDPAREWPVGLREALRRGCRLACAPANNPATGCNEVVWVASREMVMESGSEDWRGRART